MFLRNIYHCQTMLRHLGIVTCFLTLSAADMSWGRSVLSECFSSLLILPTCLSVMFWSDRPFEEEVKIRMIARRSSNLKKSGAHHRRFIIKIPVESKKQVMNNKDLIVRMS
ncbi:hypothetical protein ILYODFUR_025814 [Ilyodon furcidens]|uniref:Uncharacterized protein n=1 Tax=Ilyodon furcidens TaxID=33524 RepID=A0ABV0TB24_9TELE